LGGTSSWQTQPLFQTHDGITSNFRTSPDVSVNGSTFTAEAVYDSYDGYTDNWTALGQSSVAAPIWSGLIAVVNQGRGTNLTGDTQTLPAIYSLEGDFSDITTGSNSTGSAGSGYDMLTGLGSPTDSLINDLIGYQAVAFLSSTLPDSTVGTTYDRTLSATGGSSALSYGYAIVSGGIDGISITTSSSGIEVSGTPTASGSVTFQASAVDSYGAKSIITITLTSDDSMHISMSVGQPNSMNTSDFLGENLSAISSTDQLTITPLIGAPTPSVSSTFRRRQPAAAKIHLEPINLNIPIAQRLRVIYDRDHTHPNLLD
jgi:hypothetical protein